MGPSWNICLEKKKRMFEDRSTSFFNFCNNVQLTSSGWSYNHKKLFCNYSFSLIVID